MATSTEGDRDRIAAADADIPRARTGSAEPDAPRYAEPRTDPTQPDETRRGEFRPDETRPEETRLDEPRSGEARLDEPRAAETGHADAPPAGGTGGGVDVPPAMDFRIEPDTRPPSELAGPPRISGTWAATLVAAVVLVFLLVFVLQNPDHVTVSFLGFGGSLPLGVAMLFAAIGGALLVALIGTAQILRLRRRVKRLNPAATRHRRRRGRAAQRVS